jgi:hypothetical protein
VELPRIRAIPLVELLRGGKMGRIILFAFSSTIFCLGCSSSSQSNFPPTVTVKVSPAGVTLAVNGQQQFTATVTGTSMTAVTWSVGGLLCSGQDCGSITQSGLYTAPGVVPLQNQITVQADSQANPLDSGSAQVVIKGAGAAALRGTYTFILLGSDADGALSLTGQFEADGADHIHDGEMSLCRTVSSCRRLAFEGRYRTNQNEQGEIVVDVLPGAVLHFARAENGGLTLALDGKNNLHAAGIMTILAKTDSLERNHSY